MTDNAAAPAATLGNFRDTVSRNISAASAAPAPAASTPAPQSTPAAASTPLPGSTPATDAPALPAVMPGSQPANDNAQPATPQLEQSSAIDPLTGQPQAAPAAEPPPDPLAEAIHGATARELLDAIRQGVMPPQLMEQLRIPVKVQGRDMEVSAREAANGYMRISDYTRGTMELAQQREQLDARKQQIAALFAGWDKPEGFEQGVQRMGLRPQVNALLTKNWGTPDKPNTQEFMNDLHRLGHFGTFRAAVEQYANNFGERMEMLHPGRNVAPKTPEEARAYEARETRARQLFDAEQQQQAQLWQQRVEAENMKAAAQVDQWKRERQEMLAVQRQQQPQDNSRQIIQQIHEMKQQSFALVGLDANATTDGYFTQNYIQADKAAQYYREQVSHGELVRRAVQMTVEQINEQRRATGAPQLAPRAAVQPPAAPPQAVPAPAAQPAPSLPVRAGGAPTTAPGALRSGGTVSDFQTRMQQIRGGGR